jgi:hypothetical protein
LANVRHAVSLQAAEGEAAARPATGQDTSIDEAESDKAQSDDEARQEFLKEGARQIERLEWMTQHLLDLSSTSPH